MSLLNYKYQPEIKQFGGEPQLAKTGLYYYFTDSGRSSLRLILSSRIMKGKKIILPDYLCQAIPDVFKEKKFNCEFYHVNADLALDFSEISGKNFDVLYLIDYFGRRPAGFHKALKNKETIVIEDSIFSPLSEKPAMVKNWVGFNSLRKISCLAEGSIIKSTFKLPQELIIRRPAPFVQFKYDAKQIKHEYLTRNLHYEDKYLRLFSRAERILQEQKKIYEISARGLAEMLKFYQNLNSEFRIRRENYRILDNYLNKFSLKIPAKYYSFYPLLLKKRDRIRKRLFAEKIFLPVFWPVPAKLRNPLYEEVLCIPLDSRYSRDNFVRIAKLIKETISYA